MLFLVFSFARIIQSFENNFSRTTGRMVFLGGASGEEAVCQCRRCKRLGFNPWGGKIPGGVHGNPLQYSFFFFKLYIIVLVLPNIKMNLTWRIPWAEEPGRLQSRGSHRVEHN